MQDYKIKFSSIASSKNGNCYLLEGKDTKILIECGISVQEIEEALKNQLHLVDACLISNNEFKNNNCAFEVAAKGVNVHAVYDVFADYPKHHRFNPLRFKKTTGGVAFPAINIGNEFTVYPYPLDNEAKNIAFVIYSKLSEEKLLFISGVDYSKIKHKFLGVTHFCMECNYSAEILREVAVQCNATNDLVEKVHKTQYSFESLCDYFDVNDLKACKEIHLMQVCSKIGDVNLFKNVIETKTKKSVFVYGELN